MALSKGSSAPEIETVDIYGNPFSLTQTIQGSVVVLFFFPKAFTSVCTKEACSFGEKLDAFKELNATVVGVSMDDDATLKRFAETYNLEYTFLSDPKGKLCKAYDAYVKLFKIPSRVTYVISKENGQIKAVNKGMFEANSHIKKALSALNK